MDAAYALNAYAAFFERLTPDTVDRLSEHVVPDVRFITPFCDVKGADRMKHLIHNLYTDVEDPQLSVLDKAVGQTACFLRWEFTSRFKGRKNTFAIVGVSEVIFSPEGLAVRHHDHWDAASQLYEHFPVLRTVLGAIRRYVTES